MQTTKHSEPLIRVVKRGEIPAGKKITIRLIAVVLALIVDAMFIFFVTGLNPLDVYKAMIQGTFQHNDAFFMGDARPLLPAFDWHRAGTCIQNALLEHRRGRSGLDGRTGNRRSHGLLRRKNCRTGYCIP